MFFDYKTLHLTLVIKAQPAAYTELYAVYVLLKSHYIPSAAAKSACQVGCLPRVRSHQIKPQHSQCHSVEYHYNSTGI